MLEFESKIKCFLLEHDCLTAYVTTSQSWQNKYQVRPTESAYSEQTESEKRDASGNWATLQARRGRHVEMVLHV